MAWMFGLYPSPTPVEAGLVARSPIREMIEDDGKTRLADTFQITMPFAGRIEAIDLPEGTPVKKGQVVARVIPRDLDLDIKAATAAVDRLKASIVENDDVTVESTTLEQSLNFVESTNRTVEAATERVKAGEAKLTYAEKNLNRTRRMAENKTASQDALDQAEVNQVQGSVDYHQDVLVQRAMQSIQAATALMPTAVRQYIKRKSLSSDVLAKQLTEAQVKLQQAEQNQNRGTMNSPVEGVVLERPLTNERQVAAGTLLMKIGRWEDLEVEADVLSQEVVRVRPGQKVEIFGPAIGPLPARGEVSRIYPAGFTKVSSLGVEQQRVKVIIRLEPEELSRLRTERALGTDYRVRVRVITAEKDRTLVIHRSALFRGGDGQWQVFAVRGSRATLLPVKVGLMNDDWAEVLSELTEGEAVVLAPETNLSDGKWVRTIVRN
jgi:HlyD family secretion protein